MGVKHQAGSRGRIVSILLLFTACYLVGWFVTHRVNFSNDFKPEMSVELAPRENMSMDAAHPYRNQWQLADSDFRQKLVGAWAALVSRNAKLESVDLIAELRVGGGASPLIDRLAKGDLFAAIELEERAIFCLSSQVVYESDADQPLKAERLADTCLGHFGPNIKNEIDLLFLRQGWIKHVAQSGFPDAASYYWSLLMSGADFSATDKRDNSYYSDVADKRQLALGLLINAAENGDTKANLTLVEAYMYGRGVPRDHKLAAKFGARLIELDASWASVAWLRDLVSQRG